MRNIDPDSEENQRATRDNQIAVKVAKHVFSNCNVCGRALARDDEFEIGMCAICANEEVTEP